jgi:hypothetical protein
LEQIFRHPRFCLLNCLLPLGVPTLKNWTISPVVQAFVDYAHEVVKPSLDVNNVTTGSAGTPELLDRKANSHRSQTLQSR